jgi:hypothetical protein
MWWTDKTISVRHLASMKRFPFPQAVGFAACWSMFIYSGFAQSGASYTAQRRIDTITVDGNLNEASWAGAASTVFTLWNGNVAPVSLQTSAKMIWDDQYLFLGVTAKDPDVYATYVGRDRSLWEQDNFEVFVTVPGTTGYVEVEGSPAGAIWDGYFTNVFQGPGGSYTVANLQVAGRVNGTLNNSADQDIGFTGEIRIPFSDIYQGVPGGHPTNGTQLRLNLNRINWNTPVTQGGPGAAGSDTYYAWSPVSGTSPAFHQPSKFGTVAFSTSSVPPPTWLFTGQILSGTHLVLSGVGHPGGTFWILATTNAALPIAIWTRIATNTFDPGNGQFSFTNTLDPGSPQRFYRLQAP